MRLTAARGKKIRAALYLSTGILLAAGSLSMILPSLKNDYKGYLSGLEEHLPRESRVLANLNAGFYFDGGKLLDWRNLAYLKESGLSFGEYVRSRDIEYIVYPEEMDVIYRRRPVWNILYGNLYPYYESMRAFLEQECELAGEFSSPGYGMRIVRYRYGEEWKVRIYRVIRREPG